MVTIINDNAKIGFLKNENFLFNSPFSLISYSAYSPDLSHCDFVFFDIMKNGFKGKSFDTKEDVLNAVDDFFLRKNFLSVLPIAIDVRAQYEDLKSILFGTSALIITFKDSQHEI